MIWIYLLLISSKHNLEVTNDESSGRVGISFEQVPHTSIEEEKKTYTIYKNH